MTGDYGQPFDIDAPIYSESVVLNATGGGASLGVRLCRWPSVQWAWIWSHVRVDGRYFGYNVDFHRCGPDLVDVMGADVVYTATDVECEHRRAGPRESMRRGTVRSELRYHESHEPPNAPGDVVIRVEAEFVPGGVSGRVNPGRQEVRGTASGTVTIGDRVLEVSGGGHWHEQHQTAPRFRTPFVYASLRGGDIALVLTKSPGGTQGFVQRGGQSVRVVDSEFGPQGDNRRVRIVCADGSVVAGTARLVERESVYIYGRRRPGTLVVLEDAGLAGSINDWDPQA